MAFSQVTYTGDGVTKDFNVTFAYLDQAHVVARINKVFTTDGASGFNQEFIDSTTLRVTKKISGDPPDNGDEITLIRQTPIATPAVVFGGGASLSSANLNKNSEYLTYALQEATDANDAFTKIYLGAFATVDQPTTDNDGDALLTGASYFDTTENVLFFWNGSAWKKGDILGATEVAAAAAAASEAAALVSQNAAAASAAAALVSENAAGASETAAAASAAAALASELAAAASETAASASEAAALASENAAALSESNASASAAAALASQNAASASAAAALASENAAAASESAAAASESAAAASASAAAASAAAAATFDPALYMPVAGGDFDDGFVRFTNNSTPYQLRFDTDGTATARGIAWSPPGLTSIEAVIRYNESNVRFEHYTDNGAGGVELAGTLEGPGTTSSVATTFVTREKGDARYWEKAAPIISGGDFDTLTTGGIFTLTNSFTNGPLAGGASTAYTAVLQVWERGFTAGPRYTQIVSVEGSAPELYVRVGTGAGPTWSAWEQLGAGGGLFKGENGTTGSSAGDIFRINEDTLNTNVTIDAAENSSCTGPLTVASGITLTVNGVLAII